MCLSCACLCLSAGFSSFELSRLFGVLPKRLDQSFIETLFTFVPCGLDIGYSLVAGYIDWVEAEL